MNYSVWEGVAPTKEFKYEVVKEIFQFGLNNDSEIIYLYNTANELVDEVEYLGTAPWPDISNNPELTIELISADFDNNLGENWLASFVLGGTPGMQNSNNMMYVSGIPSQAVANGEEFETFDLDDYLYSPNFQEDEIICT